jgi:hypoxanthine phosphoribosyltransferase
MSVSTIKIHDKYFVPYLTEIQIQQKVAEMAQTLNAYFHDKDVLVLSVLNGAFMFTADLVRHLSFDPEVHFLKISTYEDAMTSSHTVKELWGLEKLSLAGKHLLVIEDIIDTGFTASVLRNILNEKHPASTSFVSLLFKPDSFQGDIPPEFIGFSIPPDFVVGYGLDYAQRGRTLKEIFILKD